MSSIAVAAVLAATILFASTISVELGLSVDLIELFAGVVVGNALDVTTPAWLAFVGSFAGIVLTFLAGAEVDVPQFRREWRASLAIGVVPFFAPFAFVTLLAYQGLGWNAKQAEIAGIALSTTSLAVVYAVLVETGAEPDRDREAADGCHLRHRLRHRPRRCRSCSSSRRSGSSHSSASPPCSSSGCRGCRMRTAR